MSTHWLWKLAILLTLFLSADRHELHAQTAGPKGYPVSTVGSMPYSGFPAAAPYGVMPASGQYGAMPAGAPYPGGGMPGGGMPGGGMPGGGMPGGGMPGGYGVAPMSYEDPGMGEYDEGGDMSGYGNDGYYPHRHGRDILDFILPYGEGGLCAPRWFDLHVDAVRLARDKSTRVQNFTAPLGNPGVILSTNSLDFDDAYGFGATAAYQMGPGSNIEFGYLGTFNFTSNASSQGPNNLYSIFSNFGLNPLGGFNQTDAAFFHGIDYSSAFNSYELDYRRRWQGCDCRFQGSWLMGVRYFQLNEEFTFKTRTTRVVGVNNIPFFMDYFTGTSNALTGFQLGGDAWITVIPGLRIGGEFKAGVFGNHAHQDTLINYNQLAVAPNTTQQTVIERTGRDSVALIGEADLMCTYRINQHWTIRGGYQFLYLDGVALAPENFNSGPPFVANARTPFFNDNGSLFLHGASMGIEFMW